MPNNSLSNFAFDSGVEAFSCTPRERSARVYSPDESTFPRWDRDLLEASQSTRCQKSVKPPLSKVKAPSSAKSNPFNKLGLCEADGLDSRDP